MQRARKVVVIPTDGTIPPGILPSGFVTEMLSIYSEYYPKIGFREPWVGYFIVEDGVAVGTCGFTGQPENNRVEIAYYTFKPFEGRGIATFACRELVSIANKTDPGLIVTAKTAPEESASTVILRRNGFRQSSDVDDHEIGKAWGWILEIGEGIEGFLS